MGLVGLDKQLARKQMLASGRWQMGLSLGLLIGPKQETTIFRVKLKDLAIL